MKKIGIIILLLLPLLGISQGPDFSKGISINNHTYSLPLTYGTTGQVLYSVGATGTVGWTSAVGATGATGITGATGTFGATGATNNTLRYDGSNWVTSELLQNTSTEVTLKEAAGAAYSGVTKPLMYIGTTTPRIAVMGDASPNSSLIIPTNTSIGGYFCGDGNDSIAIKTVHGYNWFTGKVGIGTTAIPTTSLQIKGGAAKIGVNQYTQIDSNSIRNEVGAYWDDSLVTIKGKFVLQDEGSYAAGTSSVTSGWLQVDSLGIWVAKVDFQVDADGTIDLTFVKERNIATDVVTTDTDTKFCIFDSGASGFTVRNRLGYKVTVKLIYNY